MDKKLGKLDSNPAKTSLEALTRKRNLEYLRGIITHDTNFKLKTKFKYLGVTLDQKVFWKTHVNNIWFLRSLSKLWGYLEP